MDSNPTHRRPLNQDPERCYRLRLAAGFSTQLDLAIAAGLSDATVCRIESGTVSASSRSLVKLADALGCTVDELSAEDPDLERR